MDGFEYSITFLIIYLVILVIYKIIFWLCERPSNNEDSKKEKVKTIEIEGYGFADSDNEDEKNKSSESATTYLIKEKRKKSNFNSDEYLGNYMQDVLVLNKPIPENNRLIFNENKSKESSDLQIASNQVSNNNEFKFDESFVQLNNNDFKMEEKMDDLFETIVENESSKSSVIKEYKGLSKEMKMFLIAKILDRKISM